MALDVRLMASCMTKPAGETWRPAHACLREKNAETQHTLHVQSWLDARPCLPQAGHGRHAPGSARAMAGTSSLVATLPDRAPRRVGAGLGLGLGFRVRVRLGLGLGLGLG